MEKPIIEIDINTIVSLIIKPVEKVCAEAVKSMGGVLPEAEEFSPEMAETAETASYPAGPEKTALPEKQAGPAVLPSSGKGETSKREIKNFVPMLKGLDKNSLPLSAAAAGKEQAGIEDNKKIKGFIPATGRSAAGPAKKIVQEIFQEIPPKEKPGLINIINPLSSTVKTGSAALFDSVDAANIIDKNEIPDFEYNYSREQTKNLPGKIKPAPVNELDNGKPFIQAGENSKKSLSSEPDFSLHSPESGPRPLINLNMQQEQISVDQNNIKNYEKSNETERAAKPAGIDIPINKPLKAAEINIPISESLQASVSNKSFFEHISNAPYGAGGKGTLDEAVQPGPAEKREENSFSMQPGINDLPGSSWERENLKELLLELLVEEARSQGVEV